MSIKRVLLLASAALALVAFAVPATASANTTITHDGLPINDQIIEAIGSYKYESLGSGKECTEVRVKVTVNIDVIELVAFEILNPTTKCIFFGAIFGGCEFEQHPIATNLPWVLDSKTNTHELTVTKGTNGLVGGLDAEYKPQPGKVCNITTTDITFVHEVNTSVTIDMETNAGGFIEGLKLTGKVKTDSGSPAAGTMTANHSTTTSAISGTFKLVKLNTYKLD